MSRMRKSIKGHEGNWVDMQTETFTNWVNANLQTRNMEVKNIGEDFEDGVKLINLYEIIRKKSIGKYCREPKFPNQKMDNVSLVLKAAEKDGVKMVSIDSDHVVHGNTKMILGLLWQLILRYHIAGSDDKGVKIALKKLLLIWLQHVIPEQRITNLTTDWNSGVALCNLVNVLQPGLCPEYQHLDRDSSVENLTRGMQLAEENFGIPRIISPTHMANPHVDELSMMTYLSYFTQDNGVGEKWTLNLVNGWNKSHPVTNFNTDWNDGTALVSLVESFSPNSPIQYDGESESTCRSAMNTAEERLSISQIISPKEMANPHIPELAIMAYVVQFKQVKQNHAPSSHPPPPIVDKNAHHSFKAYGEGISDPKLNSPCEIFVENKECHPIDDLSVKVTGPDFQTVPVTYEDQNPELRVYRYTPTQLGNHNIEIKYRGENVPESPALVNAKNDLTKIRVHGDSLGGGSVDSPVEFDVEIGVTNALLEVQVDGPSESKPSTYVTNNGDGTYKVLFTPTVVGTHDIMLSVNGQKLPGDPIEIPIVPSESVVVESTQYQEDTRLYAELYERIGIAVDTQNSGDGSLSAETNGPRGNSIATDVEKDDDGSYTVSFTPGEIGVYYTKVYWNNKQIQGSPFLVWVSDPSQCTTTGSNVKETRVDQACSFHIETKSAGPGKLSAYAEKDGVTYDVNIQKDEESSTYDCVLQPNSIGLYQMHVNYNDSAIKGSPFLVKVGNPKEVQLIKENAASPVKTSAVYSCMVKVNDDAGIGNISTQVFDPEGQTVYSEVKHLGDNQHKIAFTPEKVGRYELNAYYAGGLMNGCPHYVDVIQAVPIIPIDANKVKITGDGLKEGTVNDLCHINVDARDAGPGHLSAVVHGLHDDVIAGIRDNQNGTYNITYTPPTAGAYVVDVKWDDEHVEGSPFRVSVKSRPQPHSVGVAMKGFLPPDLILSAINNDSPIEDICMLMRILKNTKYKNVQYRDGIKVATNENVMDDQVVGGDGIKEGTAGQPVLFTLDGRNAGPGQLSCRCRAPSGKMTYVLISDNKDGTYTVDLNASEPGLHTVEVEWDGQPIPGSPFLVRIMQAPDVKKVRAHGPGLESGMIGTFQGIFKVDSKGAGPGTMKVRIHGPKGAFKVEMYRDHPKDRAINVKYNPSEPGLYTVNVFWSDEHIVGSPFEVFVAENPQHLSEWKNDRERVRRAEMNGY